MGAVAPPEDVSRIIKWTRPPTFGAPPPPRGGHSVSIVGNLLLVFGGHAYEGSGKFKYFSDCWALDLDSMKWHKPDFGAARGPGARYGHCAAVVDFKLYIFGGKGEGGILYNDLWVLDPEAWVWALLPSSSAAPPVARLCASMTPVHDKLALFGGWDGKAGVFGDFWLFDLKTGSWLRPPTSGPAPPARYGHSVVFDESSASLILFGGCSLAADGVPQYLGDTRSLDLRSLSWSRPRVGGDVPGPRYWHAAAQVGNVLALVGGYDGPRQASAGGGGAGKDARAGGGASDYPSILIDIPYTSGMGGDVLAGPGSAITVAYGQTDCFLFDCESSEFIQPAVAGKPIGYRYGLGGASSGPLIYIVGGWEQGRALNDVVVLDLSGLVAAPEDDVDGGAGGGGEEEGGEAGEQ